MNVIFKIYQKSRDTVTYQVKSYLLVNWLTELYETNLEPNLNYYLVWLSKQSLIKKGLIYLLTICSPFLLVNLSPYLLHMLTSIVTENVHLITSSWLTLSDSPITKENIMINSSITTKNIMGDVLWLNLSSEELPSTSRESVLLNDTTGSTVLSRLESDIGSIENSFNLWKVRRPLHKWLSFVQGEKMLSLCQESWSLDSLDTFNLNLLNVFNWEERQDNLNFLMELKDYLVREDEPYKSLENFLKLNVKDNLPSKLRGLENLRSDDELDEFIQLVMDNVKLNDYIVTSHKVHQEMQVSLDNLINVLKEMNLLSKTKSWEDVSMQGWADHILTSLRNMEVKDDQVDYQKLRKGIIYNHHSHLDKILDLVDKIETELSSVPSEQNLSVKDQELIRGLIKMRDSNDEHNVLPLHSLKMFDNIGSYSWNDITALRRERMIEDYLNYLNETLTEVKLIIRESFNDEKFSWLKGYYSQEDQFKLRITEKLNLLKNNLNNWSSNQQIKSSKNNLTVRNYTKLVDWNNFVLSTESKLKEVNQLLHQVIGQGEQSHVTKVFKETNRIRDLIDKAKKI